MTERGELASVSTSQGKKVFGELLRPFYSLDRTDLDIIEGIRMNGPGNIAAIARQLGVAPSTVSRRLENMMDNLSLQIMANLAYDKLGMRRLALELEPSPKDEEEVMRRVLSIGYCFQSYKALGNLGYQVGYKVPERHLTSYQSLFNGLRNLYSVRKLSIHLLGNIAGVGPSFDGYDAKGKRWHLTWDELKSRLTGADPIEIRDPESHKIEVDRTDLVILFSLEGDARTSLSEIATRAGVSVPTVSERLRRLTSRGLILGYVCNLLLFPGEESRLLRLVLNFPGEKEMSTVAAGLLRTPFLLSFQKEIGKNTLFVRSYVPNIDFPSFSELLTDLMRQGILQDFSITELDARSEYAAKISPQLLSEDSQWDFTI